MSFAAAFVVPHGSPIRRQFSSLRREQRCRRPTLRRSSRVTPVAVDSPSRGATVKVGDIVAVQEGTRVSLARVTGVAASGDTVDIAVLEEFVRELYVEGKGDATYASAESVRPVRSEYVPSQRGWIVLNQDLDAAKTYFDSKPADMRGRVVVEEAPKRELDPEALKKQSFPRPTREQAFFGAAFSVPLAAILYAGFASAREAYRANPGGEELMSGPVFRQIVMFASFSGAVASLVVGCSLLLYALQYKDEKNEDAEMDS